MSELASRRGGSSAHVRTASRKLTRIPGLGAYSDVQGLIHCSTVHLYSITAICTAQYIGPAPGTGIGKSTGQLHPGQRDCDKKDGSHDCLLGRQTSPSAAEHYKAISPASLAGERIKRRLAAILVRGFARVVDAMRCGRDADGRHAGG